MCGIGTRTMTDDPTPRIPPIESRDDLPAEEREHYDNIEESRGGVRGPFGVLLHSPEVAGRVGHLGAYLRFEGVLPGPARELAILTTARAFDCAFEWAAHVPIAREEGVREHAIETVADRAALEDVSEAEATVIRYGRELFDEHEVSDAAFDAAIDRFGLQGVTELTATMGYYGMIASVLNAFEVLPGDDGPELP